MAYTIPFSLAAGTPDRIVPSDRLLNLKWRLEKLLRGGAYLARFAERPYYVTAGEIDSGGDILPTVETHLAPVLEVYRLNYGLLAPFFNPDTVVAILSPEYLEHDVEIGTMRVIGTSAKKTFVAASMGLEDAVLKAGYWRVDSTPQP